MSLKCTDVDFLQLQKWSTYSEFYQTVVEKCLLGMDRRGDLETIGFLQTGLS